MAKGMRSQSNSLAAFLAARDFLLRHRTDYDTAMREFRWPALKQFNWALDYFDWMAEGNNSVALRIVHEDQTEDVRSFGELSAQSNRVANFLEKLGARKGDRLLLMLGNEVELWETLLAAMKIGVVVIPATVMLTPDDLRDRLARAEVQHVVTSAAYTDKFLGICGDFTRICVGSGPSDWVQFKSAAGASAEFLSLEPTLADDRLLMYFTSGTTSVPKLVVHSHQSYPVGHLSTMYWIGVQPRDVHWSISSPGWAKHAWSCVFAPWNAGASVFIYNYSRFHARTVIDALLSHRVTTLCAPPTVWRMLVQEPLAQFPVRLREVTAGGEPLNPEVIKQVKAGWGVTIRDGFGQTETTAMIANSPGQRVKAGSMGRVLPGYRISLINSEGHITDEGEICIDRNDPPVGLMRGYADGLVNTVDTVNDHYYHTGDMATRDADGYITYFGRADDVFKASGYRLSPFELESILIEHPAIAEAAVVASPDSIRQAVPKAFIVLAAGHSPSRELASDIFMFLRKTCAPYKRIRRIEFARLPKTISGKIRRVELRALELQRRSTGERSPLEFFDEDFL
jgi:acetyl-CoA synthetase